MPWYWPFSRRPTPAEARQAEPRRTIHVTLPPRVKITTLPAEPEKPAPSKPPGNPPRRDGDRRDPAPRTDPVTKRPNRYDDLNDPSNPASPLNPINLSIGAESARCSPSSSSSDWGGSSGGDSGGGGGGGGCD